MGLTAFTKSHGLGNDFIIIEDLDSALRLSEQTIKALCNRHFGVGADGLMIVRKSEVADYFMDYRNADGSIAEMCGNGIRVFAFYVYDNLLKRQTLEIETRAGIKKIILTTEDGIARFADVDMGEPVFESSRTPVLTDSEDFIDKPLVVKDQSLRVTCLSMGNPHCVVFVDDIKSIDVAGLGPIIERLEIFPEKINVEFAQVLTENHLVMRVWERGVGETLACGTGACAAAVAAAVNKLTLRKAAVDLPGGQLKVEWLENNHVILSGEANRVFSGQIDLSKL